jgi:hypothetical protein
MPRLVEDLAEKDFGDWHVLKRAPNRGAHPMWECRCLCGRIQFVTNYNLVHHRSERCTWCRNKKQLPDLTKQKFHRWIVVERVINVPATWKCRCACGKIKLVKHYSLVTGKSKQCRSCSVAARNRKHGHAKRTKRKSEYSTYNSIRSRGIKTPGLVCHEWMESYKAFLHDMGKRPSRTKKFFYRIHRHDQTKPFSKDNCCWRRMRSEPIYEINGVKYNLGHLAYGENKSYSTVKNRIHGPLRMSLEDALTARCMPKRLMLTAWGETKWIKDWLNDPRCLVRESSIRRRRAKGMSDQDAMSTPPKTVGLTLNNKPDIL